MRIVAVSVLLCLTACGAAPLLPDHPLAGTVWDLSTKRQVSPDRLAEAMRAADVAILGEIHDNPIHHERQAQLVAAIAPAGLAFEMIPEASEEGIQAFIAQGGSRAAIGPAIGWSRLGWPDWEMYRPVMEAAPQAYIAGGGVPQADLLRAMRAGAAAGFGSGARAYGLSEPFPASVQETLEADMIASHCDKLPEEMAAPMVEAQRLRDAAFAHAVRRARAAGGNGRAVLITGNGHARRDVGVPAAIAAAAPDLEVLTLGQVEVQAGADSLEAYASSSGLPYDYVWFSQPVDRPDPCAAFE